MYFSTLLKVTTKKKKEKKKGATTMIETENEVGRKFGRRRETTEKFTRVYTMFDTIE